MHAVSFYRTYSSTKALEQHDEDCEAELRTLDWEVLELIILLQGWGSLLVLLWRLGLLCWLLCWGLVGRHGVAYLYSSLILWVKSR